MADVRGLGGLAFHSLHGVGCYEYIVANEGIVGRQRIATVGGARASLVGYVGTHGSFYWARISSPGGRLARA